MYRETVEGVSRRSRLAIASALVAVLIVLPVIVFLWMTSVPGRSYDQRMPSPNAESAQLAARLRGHVEAIASTPHNIAHPAAYAEVQRYIATKLGAMGYQVDRQHVMAGADNLSVDIRSIDQSAKLLVIGAHYDSAGNAPGANDNGSGVAALIEIARALKARRLSHHVRLIWFANEEPPYFKREGMGSLVAAKSIAASGNPTIGMISLETIGYFDDRPGSQHYPPPLSLRYPDRGNFIAFVGMVGARPFVRRSVGEFRRSARLPSVGGVAPSFVQGIDWSDHWSFQQHGIPALMITDTAPFRYPHYHEKSDAPDKLDYYRMALLVEALQEMIVSLASAKLR